MDRIELGTQSLREYRAFANKDEEIQSTENASVLVSKLKSDNPANRLIVTSIQKMSRIREDEYGMNTADLILVNKKRIVIIIDEAHRSTFGSMLLDIKDTFPNAIFFGFTGTPIHDENEKKNSTTASIFGDELHRYSLADGIRDANVLGFDPYRVSTFKDIELRKAVALDVAKATTVDEIFNDPDKTEIYNQFVISKTIKMAGHYDNIGNYIKGIEDYVPRVQFHTKQHTEAVVDDILEHWTTFSRNSKFHAIFATSSIPEAINYYRLFKLRNSGLKVTALFDPNIDNNGESEWKTDGLVEIIQDYNNLYKQDFTMSSFPSMKKDIAARLAHKSPYLRIEKDPEKQLDLLIVVDQMLTGYDSKWINTLYLDKVLRYESVIQAFSRTNRIFTHEKPHGTIRYYRLVHTMERNIEDAVRLYSGDKPFGLFVDRLFQNVKSLNQKYDEIADLFKHAEIHQFERLPEADVERQKFASLFNEFNDYLEAAKLQEFTWNTSVYRDQDSKERPRPTVELHLDEATYLTLVLRYKELLTPPGDAEGSYSIPYDIESHIIDVDTGMIDREFMESRFVKYLKSLHSGDKETRDNALNELHQTFSTLSQEEQKYARIFLNDVYRGEVIVQVGESFRDYITRYQVDAKNTQIEQLHNALGLDVTLLRDIIDLPITESNINSFGRLDNLLKTIDRVKAKNYFEKRDNETLSNFHVNMRANKLVREFILAGGFELYPVDENEEILYYEALEDHQTISIDEDSET